MPVVLFVVGLEEPGPFESPAALLVPWFGVVPLGNHEDCGVQGPSLFW